MSDANISITEVKISEIIPNDKNPRIWSTQEKEQLKQSIKEFGFTEPIILNGHPSRKNSLIGGHFRMVCAKELGMKTVPVVYVSIEDEARESELLLRLNKNTGQFDWDILLKEFQVDFLLGTGFGELELAEHWNSLLSTEVDNFEIEENIRDISEVLVKEGDLWRLGEHRLICGDSTDPEIISRLMGGIKTSMIYTDPVYGIGFDYDSGLSTKNKYGGSKKTDKWKNLTQYQEFLEKCLGNALLHSSADLHVFIWNDQNHIGIVQDIYRKAELKPQRVLYWMKDNFSPVPHIAFNKAVEPCIYATRGKPFLTKGLENLHEFLNRDIATGSRSFDDLLDYFELWLVKRKAGQEYLHPTEKPVTLHERPLRRCSKPGDVILDMFAGSGSLMVACEQMRRRAYMAELDPVFCQVIVDRYEALTSEKAVLLGGPND